MSAQDYTKYISGVGPVNNISCTEGRDRAQTVKVTGYDDGAKAAIVASTDGRDFIEVAWSPADSVVRAIWLALVSLAHTWEFQLSVKQRIADQLRIPLNNWVSSSD